MNSSSSNYEHTDISPLSQGYIAEQYRIVRKLFQQSSNPILDDFTFFWRNTIKIVVTQLRFSVELFIEAFDQLTIEDRVNAVNVEFAITMTNTSLLEVLIENRHFDFKLDEPTFIKLLDYLHFPTLNTSKLTFHIVTAIINAEYVGALRRVIQLGFNNFFTPMQFAEEYKPVFAAARLKDKQILTIILSSGVDLNKKVPYHNQSPLSYACDELDVPMVEMCLLHGARTDVNTEKVFAFLHQRSDCTNPKIFQILKMLLTQPLPRFFPFDHIYIIIALLLEKDKLLLNKLFSAADFSKCITHDKSLLLEACSKKNFKLVEFLITEGRMEVDYIVNRKNALYVSAIDYPDAKMCKLLLNHGANPYQILDLCTGETFIERAQRNKWKSILGFIFTSYNPLQETTWSNYTDNFIVTQPLTNKRY